jgi:hypothetical protein
MFELLFDGHASLLHNGPSSRRKLLRRMASSHTKSPGRTSKWRAPNHHVNQRAERHESARKSRPVVARMPTLVKAGAQIVERNLQ